MKIGIYGTGQYGKIFYNIISKYEKVDFFVDKYKTGYINNIPIIKISDIPKNSKIYNSVATYENKVKKEVDIINFVKTLIKYPEIVLEFKKENYLWFQGFLIDDNLKEVKKLLEDEISINFFDRWVKFRETFNMKFYPYPTNSLSEQYFINGFKHSNRFVDCGAFDGETIVEYFKHNSGGMSISFEPDPKNLEKLNKIIKHKNALIYPLGVYNKTTILRFNPLGSGGSIEEDGKLEIAVTSLDKTIYNFKPDYIKMDIEGAEKDALIGAKNIIKDFSPNLAISIYHKAEDLWEIPLLIKSINSNYKFQIRCHNHLCLETILYAKATK
jgi:FkbM family methyltransferase